MFITSFFSHLKNLIRQLSRYSYAMMNIFEFHLYHEEETNQNWNGHWSCYSEKKASNNNIDDGT